MGNCDFCGKPKNTLQTYSVKIGKLFSSETKKTGIKEYTTTSKYTDIKWHTIQICKNCRRKSYLLYPTGFALIFSILLVLTYIVLGAGDVALFGFVPFPFFWLMGVFYSVLIRE
jgi:hypothetical protein